MNECMKGWMDGLVDCYEICGLLDLMVDGMVERVDGWMDV